MGAAGDVRPGGHPGRHGPARVHRVLAAGGQGAGRDERERVERHGPDPEARPRPEPGRHGRARRPARPPGPPPALSPGRPGTVRAPRRIHPWQDGSTTRT
ncbi:hypothetical protein SGPA1_30640 [Streptomyces misionensis JCM 4497]